MIDALPVKMPLAAAIELLCLNTRFASEHDCGRHTVRGPNHLLLGPEIWAEISKHWSVEWWWHRQPVVQPVTSEALAASST